MAATTFMEAKTTTTPEWQLEVLMEKLRCKAYNFKPLPETAKTIKQSIMVCNPFWAKGAVHGMEHSAPTPPHFPIMFPEHLPASKRLQAYARIYYLKRTGLINLSG